MFHYWKWHFTFIWDFIFINMIKVYSLSIIWRRKTAYDSRWPIETCLPECTADRCLFVLELIKPRPRTKLLQINWAPRFNQHCWSTISRPNEPLAPGLPLLTLLYSTCIYKTWRLHYFNPQHLPTGGQSLLSLHLLPLIVQLLVVQIKWRFIFHLTTCGTLKLNESTGSL